MPPILSFLFSWSHIIKLIVFDLLGKVIATLVNEKLRAGSYEVDWDARQGGSSISLPSGVCFYRLEAMPDGRQAGDFVNVKKMLLVK